MCVSLKELPKTGQTVILGKEEQAFNLSDVFFHGKQPGKEKACGDRTGFSIQPEANIKAPFTLPSLSELYCC